MFLLLSILVSTGCGPARSDNLIIPPAPDTASLLGTAAAPESVPQPGDVAPGTAAAPHSVLRPGDIVRLRIWREPTLSGDFSVDGNGRVVFPMIGPRIVTGLSPERLNEMLVSAYREYLRNPSIEIVLLRRINILGSVDEPGLYPVDLTMTVADALALAGGATEEGDIDSIKLIRNGRTYETALKHRTRIGDLLIRSGDQIFVPERGWVSLNSRLVATALSAGVSLLIALWLQ